MWLVRSKQFAVVIIDDNRPFSMGETDAMKDFLKLLAPQFYIPTSEDVVFQVDCLYERALADTKKALKSFEFFSVAVDGWTSPSTVHLVGVVGSGITADFHVHHFTIGTVPLLRSFSSVIAESLGQLLNRLELPESRMQAIVIDNARNMKAIIDHFPTVNEQDCMAHTLQLVLTVVSEFYGSLY